jgi:hypothetical protein
MGQRQPEILTHRIRQTGQSLIYLRVVAPLGEAVHHVSHLAVIDATGFEAVALTNKILGA